MKQLLSFSNFRPESFVVIGYPKREGDSIFNCAGVLRSNSIITEYKKQELPNYEVFDEKDILNQVIVQQSLR